MTNALAGPPRTIAAALNLGTGPGQNRFNLGVGLASGHRDFTLAELLADTGGQIPQTSLTTDFWVRFLVYVNGGRTSDKTKYPRDELRELDLDGVTKASWDGRKGTHRGGCVVRVQELPKLKPWCVVGQIHDAKSDLARLQTEGPDRDHLKLVLRNTPPGSTQEIVQTVRESYKLGDRIVQDWEVIDGVGRLLLDGVGVATFDARTDGCYLKFPNYCQSNMDTEKGDSSQRAVVDMASGTLYHWHTGWPLPPGPGPVTDDIVTKAELEAVIKRVEVIEGKLAGIQIGPVSGSVVYTVKQGDSLSAIAKRVGQTVTEILARNPGLVADRIQVGQVIKLG